MAAPVDAGRATTSVPSATLTWTVNLPASIASGDVLVAFLRGAASQSISGMSGWTNIIADSTDASDDKTEVWYRVADGTEGTTKSVTWTGSIKGAAIVWRCTGAANTGSIVESGGIAIGTSVNPDPPAITPLGGSKDYLILVGGCMDGETQTFAAPGLYSNLVQADSGTAGAAASNCRMGGASRQLTAATTENPNIFTANAPSSGWTAFTLAVYPGGPSNQTVAVSGKTSSSAFGSVTIVPGGTVKSVSGLASEASIGSPTLKATFTQVVSGLASEASLGAPTVLPGNVNVSITGLGTEASLGAVTLVPGGVSVSISGLASEATFGTVTISTGGQFVSVSGLASEGTLGSVTIATTVTIAVGGLSSEASFGTPTIIPGGISTTCTGISSASTFQTPAIQTSITIAVNGLASEALIGSATMFPGGVGEFVGGLASEAAFGFPNVSTPGGGGGGDWGNCDDAHIHLHS